MPKKKNFLGGMQNYDPKTGEYVSRLVKGDGTPATKENMPGGEDKKGFSKFGKETSSSKTHVESLDDKKTGGKDTDTPVEDVLDEYGLIKNEETLNRMSKSFFEEFPDFSLNPSNEEFDKYSKFIQDKYHIDSLDDARDAVSQILDKKGGKAETKPSYYDGIGDYLESKTELSDEQIDNQVMEMIESGKDNYEIKKWLEENDTSGDFDWYEADNYIDFLRGESAENPTSRSGIDYWLNTLDEDIIKDDYNGDLMKAFEDELLYSYDRKLDEKSKAEAKAIIDQLVETKYKRFKKL